MDWVSSGINLNQSATDVMAELGTGVLEINVLDLLNGFCSKMGLQIVYLSLILLTMYFFKTKMLVKGFEGIKLMLSNKQDDKIDFVKDLMIKLFDDLGFLASIFLVASAVYQYSYDLKIVIWVSVLGGLVLLSIFHSIILKIRRKNER